MKILIPFMLIFVSCNNKKEQIVRQFSLEDRKLSYVLSKFISVYKPSEAKRCITLVCQNDSNMTTFYVSAETQPDFKIARVLGYNEIEDVSIWIQGDTPNSKLIKFGPPLPLPSGSKIRNENEEVIMKHPLRWDLKFLDGTLIECLSPSGSPIFDSIPK